MLPVVKARTRSGTEDVRPTGWESLSRLRSAMEREFGPSKELGLTAFRVRRQRRVQVHADLCVLSRLPMGLGYLMIRQQLV